MRFANADAAGPCSTPPPTTAPRSRSSARCPSRGGRARSCGRDLGHDSRYGEQVKVAEAHPLAPQDPDAPARVPAPGPARRAPARAADLVQRLGAADVLDAIDRDPAAAFRAAGLRGRRAQEAADSWQELRVTRRLHLLLAPARPGLSGGAHPERRTARAPTGSSPSDPYELTSVFGVGFAIADRIARAARTPMDGPRAPRAAIVHAAGRGRAQRLHLPAARRAAGRRRRCWGRRPNQRSSTSSSPPDDLVARARLDLPRGHRRARGRAGRPGRRAHHRQAERAARAPDAPPRPGDAAPGDADRRAAVGAGGGVRPPPVADHRRPGHRQDRVDPDDRRSPPSRARGCCWSPRPAARRCG